MDTWRTWAAPVRASHVAFPVLVHFRSSHYNEAWVNLCGAVMDATNLVPTALDDGPAARPRRSTRSHSNLADDLGYHFRLDGGRHAGIEPCELEEALRQLRAVGYATAPLDAVWPEFSARRLQYAPLLERLSKRLLLSPAPWIGDRPCLPQRDALRIPHPPRARG